MANEQKPDQNFIEMEKKWLSHWYEKGVIEKYLHKNDNSDKNFGFLDGPITANNPMGVHHAWGRTYKDLWQKYYNLKGHKQRFQNGFDCQGLWVEVEVEKELALKTKKDIENLVPGDKKASIAKFVQLCKDRVMKFSGIQTEQSKRLGYFMNWENSYFTMSEDNNYMIWHFLKTCFENDWIYKGHESVPWCPRCETAISQHEMLTEDYKEVVHQAIYLAFPIIGREKEYLLVWTTTPWTIPANIAVAVDEKLDYSLVKDESENSYWIATDLVELFKDTKREVVKTVKGKELVGLKYSGPFDDLPAVQKVAKENPDTFHTVIPTDENILPISTTEGTGLVHTAVSAGVEDFKLGKKLGLPMIPVISDDATYIEGLDFLSGKNAKKHPELILDYLREQSAKTPWAFKIHNYKHRYPACWRCKTELVWKVADEWYISMDKPGKSNKKTLRERMREVAKKITWMPDFGLDRELDWLKNMHDWLISKKNRYWGLALPIYECTKCGKFEVIGSYDELKEKAVEGWDEFEGHTPHKPYIDEVVIKCSSCGEKLRRINDVGNPWLDAGIVPFSTLKDPKTGKLAYFVNKDYFNEWFPFDFITESFPGQFKNWFYSLIAMSTVLEDKNSFKTVLGFGTLSGEDGRPMHKSWGNSIEFNEGADKIGVDVMRWMYSRQNPADNMLFGYKKADEVRRQFYLMLWNIYKFYLEYVELEKVDPKKAKVGESSNVLDQWILSRLHTVTQTVEENMEKYDAQPAALSLEKFVSDLSTWYIRRSRDRVWVNSDDEKDKQSFYTTLHYILVNLSIILSPFMPFLPEEMYTKLTGNESVHLADWPTITHPTGDHQEHMEHVRKAVEEGHAKRKTLGVKVRIPIGNLGWESDQDYSKIESTIWDVALKELNVKNITINEKFHYPDPQVAFTEESLQHEGELRDLIREIQSKRKEKNFQVSDLVIITIPKKFQDDLEYIKKKTLAKEIQLGDAVEIT